MKKRLISALVAAIICIPIVIVGNMPFYFLAVIIALLSFKEILDLIVKDYWIRLICYINYLFLIGLSINQNNFLNIFDFKILGIILLMYCFLMLLNHKNKELNIEKCFYLIGVTVFLATSFSILIILRNMSIFSQCMMNLIQIQSALRLMPS